MQFSNFNKTNLDVKACKPTQIKRREEKKKQVITQLKFRSVKSNTQVLPCKIFADNSWEQKKNIINIKETRYKVEQKQQQKQCIVHPLVSFYSKQQQIWKEARKQLPNGGK